MSVFRNLMIAQANKCIVITGMTISSTYYVTNKMKVVSTTVEGNNKNSRGILYVQSGGEAVSTVIIGATQINSRGSVCVLQGGVASYTSTSVGDILISGGKAQFVDVSGSGYLYVSKYGNVNNVNISSGGSMTLATGATATNINWTPCIGDFHAWNSAKFEFVSKHQGIYCGSSNQLLSQYLTVNSVNVPVKASMYVMSGGSADTVTMSSSGYAYVHSGGNIDLLSLTKRCSVYVYSGGNIKNVSNYGGSLSIMSGGNVDYIRGDGSVSYNRLDYNTNIDNVNLGGVVLKSGYFTNSAKCYVGPSSYLQNAKFETKTSMVVVNKGVARSCVCDSGTNVIVSSGGIIENCVFSSGVSFNGFVIDSNSTFNDSKFIFSGKNMQVSVSSAYIYGNMILDSCTVLKGTLTLSGGTITNTVFSSGGIYNIHSSSYVRNTSLTENAKIYYMQISSGMGDIQLNYNGVPVTLKNGVLSGDGFPIHSKCSANALKGGKIIGAVVKAGGSIIITGEGSDIRVNSLGLAKVSSGGVLYGLIQAGGSATVYSGGVLNAIVDSDAVIVNSGGIVNYQ